MNTNSAYRGIKAPLFVIGAAVALIILACGFPAQASKAVPERTALKSSTLIEAPAKAETMRGCPTRFCGRHYHHHGHYYTVCYGDHDHEYYCPGHD